ncbi:hypothetical protein GOP47_0012293 [Adiantum capillus-veneris]|uniref:DNA-directed RNA polymerase III subunit RPC3 n=1 Tax=Adiantum capillus-veneris TaxID=13818 RepID=A0A9D4ZFJ2_ADICA|nr:hypothetical protein GOP47_0012293 [Adiantum capillus-veneris]
MVTQHGRKLAYEIICNQFGELVGKVIRCLLLKGHLSLPELARFSEIGATQLRNCLLVLIQHNCIQGYRVEVEGVGLASSKGFTSYVAILSNILHRMRFPKFLMLVREDLGEEAEALTEGLLEHGRLSLEQLTQRAAARSSKTEAEIEQTLRETFANLVRAHYVERCPAPEPVLPPRPPPETKRSRTNAVPQSHRTIETEESRILAAAAPMEAERFLLGLPAAGNKEASDDGISSAMGADVGQKRKRDALAADGKTMALIELKEVLWRVNFEEFQRRLRHQACVKQVRSRIDAGAGSILQAMLEATRNAETDVKQRFSAPLSMDAIMQAVRETPDGRTMTMERIRMALHMMCAESVGFITKQSDQGSQYVINLHKIIEAARKYELEGIVLKRYGKETCRIFRLLSMKGQLEQKQISDTALVALTETRDRLYKLLKEEYLQLQEVSKTADHAPSKTIYLWRVNYPCVVEHILEDMFRAASNVGLRLAHELQQEQEVLDVLRQYHHSKTTKDAPTVTLTQTQHEQVKRIRRVASILEASLLKLDDSIMLFNDC